MRRLLLASALALPLAVAPAAGAFVWPSEPAKIAKALESGDVGDRRAAAAKLGEMAGKAATPLLLKALGDTDVDVRLRAAHSAVSLQSPDAATAVLPWLVESDARIRLAACELLHHVPSPKAAVALGRVLGDPDAAVRLEAASAMGASGAAEAVGPLLGHLDDPSVAVRAEVAQSLARIGDVRAAVPLIGKIGDTAPEVRRAVARALGELGEPRAASALVLALRDGVAQVRVEALGALGRLGSAEAVVAITPLLDERGSPEVRIAALAALGKIGSDPAIRTLIKYLAFEDSSAKSSPLRDALATAGLRAVPLLTEALEQYGNANVAAGAALVLGSLKAASAGATIVRALRREALGPYAGLRALAELGDPSTISSALELLASSNPMIRREAIQSVNELLDPARHDGRAVEPLSAALRDPRVSADEREPIVRALGRTGAQRALADLLPLTEAKSLPLRMAALDALGSLGPAGQDVVLLHALGDDNASIRQHAALALALAGSERSVPELVERLTETPTEDRTAVGIAFSGTLSRAGDTAVRSVEKAFAGAGGGVRDALIEGLGRTLGSAADGILSSVVDRGADIADRRKIAEALGGRSNVDLLTRLLSDPDDGVRAAAVWSAGMLPKAVVTAAMVARVSGLVAAVDLDVAANAAAALGLLGRTTSSNAAVTREASATLCKATGDYRPYVRANAVSSLAMLGARCDNGEKERKLLAADRSEAVRKAVARMLSRAQLAQDPRAAVKDDARALARCVSEDKSGAVANACRAPFATPSKWAPVLVFVVPDGQSSPVAGAVYSLARADGLIRSGIADRRGAVFERAAPSGEVTLMVPAALAP
ncbi:MAG TPA: HEAT repeat domain-containing protein [Polyangiaceae bacterium]|nr:HEAT repeat domain-containing protein [Polyangiaceae bacterium]